MSHLLDKAEEAFQSALANDLDISGALGAVFSLVKDANHLIASGEMTAADAAAVDDKLKRWDRVLSIIEPDKVAASADARIEALIQERLAARQAKNFARADEIRLQLAAEGVILQDTPTGTRWKRG